MVTRAFFVGACTTFVILALLFNVSDAVSEKEACKAVKRCLKRLDAGKKCKLLPVADSAVQPPVPQPFGLKEVRKGVWTYDDGSFITVIARHGARLVMVDIPDSSSSKKEDGSKTKYTDAAEMVMNGTAPEHIDIVYSHEHYDHIGATNLFIDYMKMKYPSVKFSFWGTEATKRMIEHSVVRHAPVPDVLIGKKGKTLKLTKGLEIKFDIVGGHAQEDLRVYIPPNEHEGGLVYYVDIIFPHYATTVNIGISEDIGQAIRVMKGLLELDFEFFVPGHFFMGTREDIEINIKYFEDLIDAARQATEMVGPEEMEAGGFSKYLDPEAREYGNLWFLALRVVRGTETDVCYRIMLEKWGCKLYGFDIVGHGHCLSAIIHYFTEY